MHCFINFYITNLSFNFKNNFLSYTYFRLCHSVDFVVIHDVRLGYLLESLSFTYFMNQLELDSKYYTSSSSWIAAKTARHYKLVYLHV